MNKISSYFSNEIEVRLFITGLDDAGKTTILHTLQLEEAEQIIPTIGFNFKTVKYRNLTLIGWNARISSVLRGLWRKHVVNMSAVIFVIDSNNREKINEACEELHEIVNDEVFQTLPVLIFANKQDLSNVMSLDELKEKLNLSKLDHTERKWFLQPSTATENKGIDEGFLWLAQTLKSKNDQ